MESPVGLTNKYSRLIAWNVRTPVPGAGLPATFVTGELFAAGFEPPQATAATSRQAADMLKPRTKLTFLEAPRTFLCFTNRFAANHLVKSDDCFP